MRIILLESPHTSQTGQRPRKLVSVQDAKVGHSPRQLAIASFAMFEDETMPRTVHGFQPELVFFDGKGEHVVLVVLPVSRRLPELGIVHVGRADLVVAPLPVLVAEKRLQRVVDALTVGKKEARAGR